MQHPPEITAVTTKYREGNQHIQEPTCDVETKVVSDVPKPADKAETASSVDQMDLNSGSDSRSQEGSPSDNFPILGSDVERKIDSGNIAQKFLVY